MAVCSCVHVWLSVLLLDRAWVCSPDHSKAGCCVVMKESTVGVIIIIIIKMYLFTLALLGLHCYVWAFSSCCQWGLLFVAECRFLIVVASALVDSVGSRARWPRQLQYVGSVVAACGLWSAGSVVMAHRLSCSTACGIFPDQRSNQCPLHRQMDS